MLFDLFYRTHTDVRAMPYFVAIALMSKASLTASERLSGLLVYNLAFVVPLLMFVAVHRVYLLRFDVLSEWIDGWMRQWGPRVLRYRGTPEKVRSTAAQLV